MLYLILVFSFASFLFSSLSEQVEFEYQVPSSYWRNQDVQYEYGDLEKLFQADGLKRPGNRNLFSINLDYYFEKVMAERPSNDSYAPLGCIHQGKAKAHQLFRKFKELSGNESDLSNVKESGSPDSPSGSTPIATHVDCADTHLIFQEMTSLQDKYDR